MYILRFFSNAARSVASSKLAQLRNKTGFTLVNCRKALQLCNNDLAQAEQWLQAEATRLGWEKAMKLQTRTANEGLVAVAKENNKIVMVEVNCETDFVAKNEKFVSLAQVVAQACLRQNTPQSDTHIKKSISQEELADITTSNEEKLSDYVVKKIGEFGENIILRRGFSYVVNRGINVDIAVHPPITDGSPVLTGKYGVFVAYEKIKGSTPANDNAENVGKNLCKHIIGSNPKRIGSKDDEPTEDVDDEVLLNQEYMLNPEVTVAEFLDAEGIKVIDFQRYQCGEDNQIHVKKKQLSELE